MVVVCTSTMLYGAGWSLVDSYSIYLFRVCAILQACKESIYRTNYYGNCARSIQLSSSLSTAVLSKKWP